MPTGNISINKSKVIELVCQKTDQNEALIKALTDRFNLSTDKTIIRSGVFNRRINTVLYTKRNNNEPTIRWMAEFEQPQASFEGYGWIDAAQIKVNGNTSEVIGVSGDIASANGDYFASSDGTPLPEFNHENYGSFAIYSFMEEFFTGIRANCKLMIQRGSTNVSYLLFITNTTI